MPASQYERQFAVRVVALDYHYAAPKPGLDPTTVPATGAAIKKVCVVRVFGSTLSGQTTCLHVHQVCCWHAAFKIAHPMSACPLAPRRQDAARGPDVISQPLTPPQLRCQGDGYH